MSINIKDRIVDFQRVPMHAIADNVGNWRLHPDAQNQALKGILGRIGITGALLAYYSERNDGVLTLIDGHLRKEIAQEIDDEFEWPVLITDLNDEEADLILTTFDAVGEMAGINDEALEKLLESINFGDDKGVNGLIESLKQDAERIMQQVEEDELDDDENDEDDENGESSGDEGPEGMELKPFEHYDYVLLVFKKQKDFEKMLEIFEAEISMERKSDKIGLGAAIDGPKFIKKLRQIRGINIGDTLTRDGIRMLGE